VFGCERQIVRPAGAAELDRVSFFFFSFLFAWFGASPFVWFRVGMQKGPGYRKAVRGAEAGWAAVEMLGDTRPCRFKADGR